MLKVHNLDKTYELNEYKNHVLKNVSLTFNKGEFVTIIGESGSGKSTFLNILAGLDQDYIGDYFIDEENAKDINWCEFRKKNIGFIFQSFNLLPNLTAIENVELAMTINGIGKKDRHKKAVDVLIKVGLLEQMNKKPGYMSGGEQQRVAIARALVNEPDIIFADEPTGQLDTETSREILELIQQLGKNKLVVMVTHMEEFAKDYSTRLIELGDGKIIRDVQLCEIATIEEIKTETEETRNTVSNKSLLLLSMENTWSRKLFSIFVLLVMTLGISVFILITGIGNALKRETNTIIQHNNAINIIDFTIYGDELNAPLFNDYDDEIKEIDNVKSIYNITQIVPVLNYNENINLNGQLYFGRDQYLKSSVYMMNEDSYFVEQLLIGNYPNNKNQILVGSSTARNLVYEYYKLNNLDYNSIINLTDDELFNKLKNIEITLFTTHSDNEEFRIKLENEYFQAFNTSFNVSGIVSDGKLPLIANYYRSDFEYYEPRIFVREDLFSDIINQYNNKPLDSDIYEYYRPHLILVETISPDNYQLRQDTIREILSNRNEFHYLTNKGIDELYDNINRVSMQMISIGIVLGSINFLISSIIIGGLINRSLNKRKAEFGVLVTLGFSSKEIKHLLMFEGILLSIGGILLSYISLSIIKFNINDRINTLLFGMFDEDGITSIDTISFPWYTIFIVFLLVIFVFTKPVRKFSNLNVIDVLREE